MMLFFEERKEAGKDNPVLLPDEGLLLEQQDPSFFLRAYGLILVHSIGGI